MCLSPLIRSTAAGLGRRYPARPLFWFPRDCPRGCIWPASEYVTAQTGTGSSARARVQRIHVTESGWLRADAGSPPIRLPAAHRRIPARRGRAATGSRLSRSRRSNRSSSTTSSAGMLRPRSSCGSRRQSGRSGGVSCNRPSSSADPGCAMLRRALRTLARQRYSSRAPLTGPARRPYPLRCARIRQSGRQNCSQRSKCRAGLSHTSQITRGGADHQRYWQAAHRPSTSRRWLWAWKPSALGDRPIALATCCSKPSGGVTSVTLPQLTHSR